MPLAQVGGIGDAIGPDQWFRSLPIITQYWFGAVLAVTLAGNFGIIQPQQLFWHWESIKTGFELWRCATCFLFMGKFSFNTLISCYMLVSFSQKYEGGGPFNTGAGGGTADYAFCLIFAVLCILLTYPILSAVLELTPFFAANLVYFVLYLWSKRNPTTQANIWGVPMPGSYLPFAYLGLSAFMGHNVCDMLHGYFIAHLYYFLAEVVPQVQGKDILHTPQILIDHFGVGEYRPADPIRVVDPQRAAAGGGAQAPAAAAGGGRAAGGGGYHWGGGGRVLGRDQ